MTDQAACSCSKQDQLHQREAALIDALDRAFPPLTPKERQQVLDNERQRPL